jgi:hypothetical protein
MTKHELPKLLALTELVKLVNDETLELPDVQRGFVWKTYQIEDVWDSLLRGFPVGSIIVSEKNDGNTLQLLDGQQRTTSIVLGFSNIEDAHEATILNSSSRHIRIFIDMKKPDVEGRHFIFRVITRSHPWGYEINDNKKPLAVAARSEAMDFWNINDDIFGHPIEKFYPWDSYAPLPLNIFINSAIQRDTIDTLTNKLIHWVNTIKPENKNEIDKEKLCHWFAYLYCLEDDFDEQKCSSTYSIDDIYERIKRMIENYRIPMLPLDLEYAASDIVGDNIKSKTGEETETDEKEDDALKDDIEEIFIRLNTSGIPLAGEELNYSIAKSNINRGLQKNIENACHGIMKPSRFIALAYRLFQNCKTENNNSIDMRANPKQFQREMKANVQKFADFLDEILNKDLLGTIQKILKYGENGIDGYKSEIADYRLPYPLFVKIAAKAPEAMFVLMYRVYKMRDTFIYDTERHRKMIGIMLLFMWHGQYLQKIWGAVKILPAEKMWNNTVIDMMYGKECPVPKDNSFLQPIKDPNGNADIWTSMRDNQFLEFFANVMCNKEILLYIQRKFIAASGFFPDNFFELEDTNMPFDYDHISPQKFVRGKKKNKPPKPLTDIYGLPCNLRVWPFSLNRADSDDAPAVKFIITKKSAEKQSVLRGLLEKKGIKDDKDINNFLLESSFCKDSWHKFSGDWLIGNNVINKDNWKKIYTLLWERWKNIFDDLSKELCFKGLSAVPADKIDDWGNVIKGNLWESLKYGDMDSDNFYQLPIDNMYFYLYADDDGMIQFGIYGDDIEVLSKYKGNYDHGEDPGPKKNDSTKYWIYKPAARLSCPCGEGYKELYKDIKKWLKGLKFNGIGDKTIEKLEKNVRQEFKG